MPSRCALAVQTPPRTCNGQALAASYQKDIFERAFVQEPGAPRADRGAEAAGRNW